MPDLKIVMDLIEDCEVKNQAIIVETDEEPAIRFLVDDVCMARQSLGRRRGGR